MCISYIIYNHLNIQIMTLLVSTTFQLIPHRCYNYIVLASIAVDRGFELRSEQIKDYKFGNCCYYAKHAA
jgi:hypothetical protein